MCLLKIILLGSVSLGLGFLIISNLWVSRYAQYATNHLDLLPTELVCLVLGTNKTLANGQPNAFYQHRMEAAAQVYRAGKCQKLIVSGALPTAQYNEPDEMKNSLIVLGVPAEVIFCDYAGIRTLDSVVRFKQIFGQSSGIVVSQEFHNARAIYIAQHHQIQLTGFNAQELSSYRTLKTRLREIFSKGLVVLDVLVFHTKPRYLGDKIPL